MRHYGFSNLIVGRDVGDPRVPNSPSRWLNLSNWLDS
jgi:hypothetical protein